METTGIDLEDKYTYVPPFPKLEDLAILAVSLDLWNYYYSHYHADSSNNELKKVNEIVNDMKMPNCIKEKIIDLCETIDDQLDSYHDHDPDIMKLCNAYENRKHFFLYVPVWDTNGHINDMKTAEKVLQYPERLNDNDAMFRVIAKYCLEKYINNFSLSLLSKNWDTGYYKHETITLYWWRKLHTEDKIASGRSTGWEDIFRHEQRRLLQSLKQAQIEGWHVYEYFWDFLDEDDHLSMAKNLIQSTYRHYQMSLFSKLSRHQLTCLYSEEPVAIIANFFQLDEFKLAKVAWDRVKSTIQGEEFQKLIEKILDWEMYDKNNDNDVQCLVDVIWNSAPDNLIDYVINVNDCEITEIFFSRKPKYVSSSSFNFLKVILPRATVEFRKQFFLQKGLYLISNYEHVFSTLIEHCLDVSDQVEIKETILVTAMESEPRKILACFRDVFLNRSFEDFYRFLTFLTEKHDLQTRVKKRFLRSGLLNIRRLAKVDIWANVSLFIDELYPKEEEARRQKRKMIFSYWDSHCSYWGCFRRNGEDKFTEIDNLITQYLTQEEIVKYKENTANKFREVCTCPRWLSSQHIKRVNIPKLISWCYSGDEERISQYRRSFPIDTAFHLLLRDIVERVNNFRDGHVSFSSMEELLRWKFSSKKKKIKTFKRSQLYNIMRIPYISYNLRCTRECEISDVLKEMIPWFFDDDESKIKEFQQLYQEKDTIKIIHWLRIDDECQSCGWYCYWSADESD
ncbi:uncharacterized protein LOC135846827 isoform X2 [Planococcus citri]|uniref:uncharacterized protein LOC135846827 isoform X2 n=1 Tax=Planococcus citri TaxID=170843 RepID=UPI0031F75CD9